MNSIKFYLILSLGIVSLSSHTAAGPLEAPAAPTNSASAMFTLQDIYNRITLGAPGSLREGGFAEPSSGPTNGTGRTLNEIMQALPTATNAAAAATAADVPAGLIFWGLSGNEWGLRVGTAPVELQKPRPGASAVHGLTTTGLPVPTGGTGAFTGTFTVPGIASVKVTDKNGNEMTVVQAEDNLVRFTIPPGTGSNRYTLSINNQVVPPLYYLPSENNGLFLSYDAPVISSVSGCAGDVAPNAAGCSISGGETIYIDGANFGINPALISVTIAGQPAANLQMEIPGSRISVTCPAGSGYDLPILVTVDGISSSPSLSLSYTGPTANHISVSLGASHVATPFTITGSGFGSGAAPIVKYGLAGQTFDEMPFTATVTSFSDTEIHCESQIGGSGGNLAYIVKNEAGQTSRPAGDLSYDAPFILSNTIRFTNSMPGSPLLVAKSASDTIVQLDVVGVGNVANVLRVAMGFSGGPYLECGQVSVVDFGPAGSTLQFRVPAGSGDGYVFVVSTLNQTSPESSDTFNYPALPNIESVSGCNDIFPGTTCNTDGGTTLTIVGSRFSWTNFYTTNFCATNFCATDLAVLIGGTFCADVVYINENTIQCKVPPGTGENVPVIVKVGPHLSTAFSGFSYAFPSITKVKGATDSGSSTFEVSRAGMSLTIEGNNFGASGARVLVGGVLANNVFHDLQSPHTKLTFTCPPRSTPPFYDLPVTIINASGNFSVNSGTLSYE